MKKIMIIFSIVVVCFSMIFVACSNTGNGDKPQENNNSLSQNTQELNDSNNANEVEENDFDFDENEDNSHLYDIGKLPTGTTAKYETTEPRSTTEKEFIIYKDGTTSVIKTTVYVSDTTKESTSSTRETTTDGRVVGEPDFDD